MHLGNGIICPVTGIPMILLASAGAVYAYKKAKENFTKDKILPAVVLTVPVFALQMINFAIPATTSSGHIVGGILLAALLGPYVGFLSMCLILIVQSVFFGDGALMALGCNVFNMGILACFVCYPLFYKPFADKNKHAIGAITASILALQLGSIAVVIEGVISGSIPSGSALNFTGLMQFIHLPIGLFEGIVSALIIVCSKNLDTKKFSLYFGMISLILAGFISNYASKKPDGLEWSLLNISDSVVLQTQGLLFQLSGSFQAKTALLAEMNPPVGNVIGLFALALVMYLVCISLRLQAGQINEQN